jgi:DNA repair protein RadC
MKRDYDYYLQKAKSFCVREITEIKTVRTPEDAWRATKPWHIEKQECFLVIGLNGNHEPVYIEEVSRGLVNRCLVHPREVFSKAIVSRCAGIIFAHNHPSGNREPSKEDRDITRRIKEAGQILGIPLLDHIILTEKAFYSFQESGDL